MSRKYGRLLPVALAGACVVSSACAARQSRVQADFGIPSCRDGADRELLSTDALQCWFGGPNGRWRMLNHQSHLQALVVEVDARDLRDATHIAERIVNDPMARDFSEILVYVTQRRAAELNVRRVRWTRGHEFETLDYSTRAADTPLTVRSGPAESSREPHPDP